MRSQKINKEIDGNVETGDRPYSLLSLIMTLILYPLLLQSIRGLENLLPQTSFESPLIVTSLSPEEVARILKQFESPKEDEKPLEPVKKILATPQPAKAIKAVKKKQPARLVEAPSLLLPSAWAPQSAKASKQASKSEEGKAKTLTKVNVAMAPSTETGFGFQSADSDKPRAGASHLEASDQQLFQLKNPEPVILEEKVSKRIESTEGLILKPVKKDFEIRGGLSSEVIWGIVNEHQIELRYCYEIQLLKAPQLEGDLMTIWTIDSEGRMASIAYESESLGSTDLIPCIDSKMKNWKFPKPEGGGLVNVRYPFKFNRSNHLEVSR